MVLPVLSLTISTTEWETRSLEMRDKMPGEETPRITRACSSPAGFAGQGQIGAPEVERMKLPRGEGNLVALRDHAAIRAHISGPNNLLFAAFPAIGWRGWIERADAQRLIGDDSDQEQILSRLMK